MMIDGDETITKKKSFITNKFYNFLIIYYAEVREDNDRACRADSSLIAKLGNK